MCVENGPYQRNSEDRLLSQPNTRNRAQISVLLGCKSILPFVSRLRSRAIKARGSLYIYIYIYIYI